MSVFLQPIYSQTVGSTPVATITFNNIPQGFTDLVVMASVRGTAAFEQTGIYMSFNNDSSQSYSYQTIEGSGTLAGGGNTPMNSFGWFGNAVCATGTANTFATAIAYIVDYSGANYKQTLVDYAPEQNSVASYYGYASNLYKKTNPITSLTIHAANATAFSQYSTVTVYGVSNVFDTSIPTAPTIGTVTDAAGFASVAFTAGNNADSYVVTSSPSGSTTYGSASPILTPAVLGTSYTYQVAGVNSLGSSASSASSALTTVNNYTSIATGTISTTTTYFDFNNIPQNYKHLQLRIRVRGAGANPVDYFLIQVLPYTSNSSYYTHAMEAVNDTNVRGSVLAPTNTFSVNLMSSGNQNINNFTALVVDFYDYTNTAKGRNAQLFGGFSADNTTGGQNNGNITLSGSQLPQYIPIANLRIAAYTNLTVGSTFSLYGVS
jgi:hypothetical protein